MVSKIKISLIILLILFTALFTPMPQAQRVSPDLVIQPTQARTILVSRYDSRCNGWVEAWEV